MGPNLVLEITNLMLLGQQGGEKLRESISCQWNIPWGKGYGQRTALLVFHRLSPGRLQGDPWFSPGVSPRDLEWSSSKCRRPYTMMSQRRRPKGHLHWCPKGHIGTYVLLWPLEWTSASFLGLGLGFYGGRGFGGFSGFLCIFEDWDELVRWAFVKNYRGLMLLLPMMMMMQWNVEKSLRQ